MDEQPITMRIFPGELSSVYYANVMAFRSTPTLEVIRLSLERLQIYEDKTLYELYEGQADNPKESWRKLDEEEFPISIQELWQRSQPEMRFYLQRKEHASLILSEIVSQYISPDANEGRVEDLCNLEELSEQDMLSNLRARFNNKNIYTYVGSILISVNPYYYYSIYNPKYTAMYMGKLFGALPPHIFAVADNAYHSMLNDRFNQSIIISGESGAGKTESTKFLLHHIMSLSAKLDESQSLELITLGTGPVLEAFGNARTVANNNSSRFGKFILIKFRENGAYHSASIEKYLLEKSRIVSQAPEERNYHVFYYLLSGADAETKAELQLMDIDSYQYLTQGSSLTPENGAEEYHRLRQSLSMLQFSDELQMRMFTVLSAILHIGNVSFVKKDGEEAVVVGNRDTLTLISSLLQVEEKTLHDALTTRKSLAGGTDFFVTPYRVEEAVAMRDTLARALYGALFDWIVDQVNVTLAACGVQASHKGNSIGVLDIFGFEVFQKNSFEQFCINYANEQLQQYFNKHIFKIEQVEYEAEGIEWSSVSFVDNQECLDLIAKKPTGLLQLLDEECSFPGADDNTLFQKFERQHKNHPHYRSPQLKQQDPQFTILHYASEVTYSVKGFREKNRDLLRSDIVNVLQASRMDLVRALIGLPPYTVYRWHMAYLKVIAAFAFRRAGELHRAKLENRFVPFKFRHGSSPILSHQDSLDGSKEKYVDPSSQPLIPSKPSAEAFPLEHGRLRVGGGLRTSRSYDLITDAVKEDEKAAKEKEERDGEQSQPTPSHVHSYSLPYGASPRSSRKNLSSTPQGDATFPLRTKSQPASMSTPTGTGSPISSPSQAKKQLAYARTKPSPPTVLAKPAKSSTTKQIKGREGRSHALSATKPRKHRSNQQSKEAPANLTPRIWRSAPRMKSSGSSSDPRLLHSLARKPSLRVGPSKTVSAQFHMSLVSLMERLEMTNPFFVRCIKSNNSKSPCQFDDDLVLRQLRYTGMMETIKIRKSGYSVRVDFKDFYEKYQFLIGAESSSLGDQINAYLAGLGFGSEHFQIGKTKVFMREKQKQALQTELGDKVLAKIIVIQRWTRAKLLRCRFLHFRRSAITIQCAVRCWRAKKRANYLRKRVCSAVLIQSAWKTYTARKKLILLKQAAIILQAHYKGRLARKRYAVLLEKFREEKERKRKEEELLRKKREREKLEAQRKERKERRERELQEALRKAEEEQRLHQQVEEATAAQDGQDVVVRRRTKSDCHDDRLTLRETRMLDAEVVDTLFQFDSIVSELERETLADNGVSPMITPSPNTARRKLSPSSSSQHSLEQRSTPSSELSSSVDSDICREPPPSGTSGVGGTKQFPSPPRHRALPNVNQLKQQFLSSPQRPGSAPLHRDLKHDNNFPLAKGNVKHIIAQMQTTTPEVDMPRSLTPPFVDEQVKKRHSIAIQSKILEFNQQKEEKRERRLSQSYTPPSVRRKIQSPFLRQDSKVKSEETIMHAPEKYLPTARMEEYLPPMTTEEARMEEECFPARMTEEHVPVKTEAEHSPTKMEELSLARAEEGPPPPSSREKSPNRTTKEMSPARVKELSPVRTKELSPTRLEEDMPTRTDRYSPARTEEQLRIPSKEPSPVRTKEKSPVRTEEVSPRKTKQPSPIRIKEKTPTPASPHRLVVRAEDLVSMEERSKVDQTLDESQQLEVTTASEKRDEAEETQSKSTDSVTKTEGGSEDSMVMSPPGTGDSTESNHLVSFLVLSPPHRKPSKKKVKVESPSHNHKPPAPEPPADVATPEDIELSFADLQGTSTSDVESEHRYEAPGRKDSLMFESPHHVEVVIGMKENGVFSPPKVVDGSEETSMYGRPNQYDHLKAKSQYDHLAPLEPGEDPYQPFQRHRSASDVTSHRIRPLSKRSLNDEFTESEVIHREEHRYGSLQQRKRVALSVADPTDYIPQSSFEESSEFTRRLTSEEIRHLNQRQQLHSPSDRLRLFSFTKRHLKLPFSRSKKQRDKEKPLSPEKEAFKSPTPLKQKRSSPTSARFSASERHDGGKRSHHDALAHNFKQTSSSRFSMYQCEVCHKGFTGFMKQALRCVDCYIMVHRHCEDRVPPCKAHIESGSYVTMSRNKVVKKLEDLDNLGQFLLEKIATLSRDEQPGSLVDRVFKLSLSEFHTSLISSYSLTLQSSLESSSESHRGHGDKPSPAEEPKVSITFSQLVNNFSNIFKGIAKREGLNDPCHISIGINQIKTFLDEFSKARRAKRYSASINPSALRRKAPSGKELQPKVHKGHRFLPRQFKVATVCEYCSKLLPLLESGEVCEVCGYTCHEDCYKKTHKKCEGKGRSKPIPEYNPKPVASNQFGIPLTNLVPPGAVKVPPILEKCFQYLENQGLYTQGVYRKSAGVSSKKAVRAALEEDPENASLEGCSVHAVAAAVGGFFRELPEPLLTRELYIEFIRAMDLTSKKEKLETLHKLVHRLPELNYIVFERLIFHLARFAQHEHINKMSPNNLAIIFAPCLLQSKEKKNPEEILKDLPKQTECLEVIITEQVEKLTATLRGIRSLTSHARSKASKLTQLIDQFESTQGDSSTKPSDQNIVGSSLSEEERKRLANELEEIERERVELTVNLPKLEPFILSEDEMEPHEQESGSSEHWTLSPSPPQSPSLSQSSGGSFFSRSLQGFPPIREATGEPASFSVGGSFNRRRASSMKSPPKSPSNPSIVVETSSPSGSPLPLPKLKHLTKDRVSQKPAKRPPSRKEASNRTASSEALANSASRYMVDMPTDHQEGTSPLNSHWDDDTEDIMFMESTV